VGFATPHPFMPDKPRFDRQQIYGSAIILESQICKYARVSEPYIATLELRMVMMAPPDDSGSDTFRRYCYQAHVAFPFCLKCALGEDILSVVAEHVEDVAIEEVDKWRFLQVKTRNPELGPWRLSHLTSTGGALHSAFRSHKVLPDVSLTIEILLEGSISPKDEINLLRSEEGRRRPELCEKIQQALGIDPQDCESFMSRIRLTPGLPSRDSIVDRNLRLLGNHASNSVHAAILAMYERAIMKIYDAMQGLLDENWFELILSSTELSDDAAKTFEAKRLTRDALQEALSAALAPSKPLLKRILDQDAGPPSVLEQKLLVGGAPPAIIATAKSLRANAAIEEFENAATTLWGEDNVLDDVRERLRMRVESIAAVHAEAPRPAVPVWATLIERLPGWAPTVDQYWTFRRDPDLLLGEICQMADLCQIDWGQASAD
jgi:hypothetical protein